MNQSVNNQRKYYTETSFIISFFFCLFSLFMLNVVGEVQADCSCYPTGGLNLQAIEFMAKSCATEADDDNTIRVYVSQRIGCENQMITPNPYFYPSEGYNTPANIIAQARSYNLTRILRNEEGTHLIAVHKYYTGTVAGVSPPVAVTVVPNLNEYCTGNGGLPDADQDNYPDCLDCDPLDAAYNENCIVIPKNLGNCP